MKYSIADRIIPCPKCVKGKQGYSFFKNRIQIVLKTEETPPIKTGIDLLESFCEKGYIKPDFVITLKIIDENYEDKRLNKCCCKDQAYVIKPVISDKVYSGLDLLAYTDIGLYYACTTLHQVIRNVSERQIEIPFIEIVDWPSIPYRGLFLGDCIESLPKTSFIKLNALDFVYDTKNKEKEDEIYANCEKYGVTVFSVVFEWDDPKAIFERLYKNEKRNNILFWISEGADEAELYYETGRIVEAFNEFSKQEPLLKGGIITNHKGTKTFERVFAMKLPAGFSISYCDKIKTYNTEVKEITDSCISAFTKRDGLMGIYPMIAFDSKSFFLFTAPEFIQFRCLEFDRIDAFKVMGYTPFACIFINFNITAFAEWLWNPKGRNTIDFIKAYSYKKGLDFDKYENFLYYLTFASWSLQRSNFVQCICEETIDFKQLKKLPRLNQMANDTLKSIKFAESMGDAALINEAKVTYSAINAYAMTKKLLKISSAKKPNRKKYIHYREKLDEYVKTAYTSLMDWAELAKQEAGTYNVAVYDTAKAFLHLPSYFNKFPDIIKEIVSETQKDDDADVVNEQRGK